MKHDTHLRFRLSPAPKMDGSTSSRAVTPQELSDALCELRYDCLANYLVAIAERLEDDSASDNGRGRGQLGRELFMASAWMRNAVGSVEDAWDICKPYMNQDETEHVNNPIGSCPKCGALWYTDVGFCGGCK